MRKAKKMLKKSDINLEISKAEKAADKNSPMDATDRICAVAKAITVCLKLCKENRTNSTRIMEHLNVPLLKSGRNAEQKENQKQS